jgi:hypothetical protein
MIRVTGRYRNQHVELDAPLSLPEGTSVEIAVHVPEADTERDAWGALGMSRLEEEWDNPEDAIYDDWKRHYGV